ncbi:MAG: hypothetical protein WCG45_02920 [bacterium]
MKNQQVLVKAIVNDIQLKKLVEEMIAFARRNYITYEQFVKIKDTVADQGEGISDGFLNVFPISEIDEKDIPLKENSHLISLGCVLKPTVKILRPLQVTYVEFLHSKSAEHETEEQEKYEDGKEYNAQAQLTISSIDGKELNIGDVSRLKCLFFDKSNGEVDCPALLPPFVTAYTQEIKNKPRKF